MERKVLPIFQVAIALILIGVLNRYFPLFDFKLPLRGVISSSLMLLSIVVAFLAVYSFSKHKTTVNPTTPEKTSVIVNTGIYAYSRNPMYLAMAIFLLSMALFCENFLSLLPVALFIWFISKYQIVPEEQTLIENFGENYQNYLTDVRRWL